jgi:dihydropteroate synthase
VLLAISRKSFIGDLLGKTSEERLAGTLALTARLLPFADMVRAHDVAETHDALFVVRKLENTS